MNQDHIQPYVELLQQLLSCPAGDEPGILQAHEHLLDETFVAVALAIAQRASHQGENNAAQFLQQLAAEVATQIGMNSPELSGGQPMMQGAAPWHWLVKVGRFLAGLLHRGFSQQKNDDPTFLEDQWPAPLLDAIQKFITADSWNQSQRMVEQHPELLSEDADRVLGQLLEMAAGQGQEQRVLQEHRDLLKRCREIGIEHAFEDKWEDHLTEEEAKLAKLAELEFLPPHMQGLFQDWMEQRAIPQADIDLPPEMQELAATPEMQGLIEDVMGELVSGNAQIDSPEDLERWLRNHPQLETRIRQMAGTVASQMMSNLLNAESSADSLLTLWLQILRAEAKVLYTRAKALSIQAEERFDRVVTQRAITANEESAQISRRLGLEELLYAALNNLANMLCLQSELGIDPAVNLQQATTAYTESAQIARRLGLERYLASILHNLGRALCTQADLGIDPVANLERAIAAYEESAQISRQLGLEHQLSGTLMSQVTARLTQAQLGIDPAVNLEQAIATGQEDNIPYMGQAAMKLAQRFGLDLSGVADPKNELVDGEPENMSIIWREHATIQKRNLSNYAEAYAEVWQTKSAWEHTSIDIPPALKAPFQELMRLTEPTDQPRQIQILHQLLYQVTQAQNATLWAVLQFELGNSYAELLQGDRAQNIEDAIAAYQQALMVVTQQAMPIEWAAIMRGLSDAYRIRIQGDRAQNIEDAIAACQQALMVMTQQATPFEWAATMVSLANAYRIRIQGNKVQNIEDAIFANRQALTVVTQQAMPFEWAQIMNNLANAYRIRIQGDKAQNIEDAIATHQQALAVRTQQAMPLKWAETMNNLANAYSTRIQGDEAQNIEDAIFAYRQALTVVTQQAMPFEWAETMNNLANAYSARIQGDKAQNIEDAIATHQQALAVRTQQATPLKWAETMMNLANAYSTRIQGDEAQNVENAITAYEQALTVLTPKTNPYGALIAAFGLGNLHFGKGDWQLALDEGYLPAIQSVEQTRTWATDDAHRQALIKNAIGVYDNALQCHINLGQYNEAILLTERARSRHLVDLIHSNDLYKGGAIPADVQVYLNEYETLQHRIDNLHHHEGNDGSQMADTTLRAQQKQVWQQLRARDQVLADGLEIPEFDFAQLSQLIATQPRTAILSIYTTQKHTYILVLRHPKLSSSSGRGAGSESGITCHLHTCSDQGFSFQNWILQNWLNPYQVCLQQRNLTPWIEAMPDRLEELSNRLQLNALISKHLQGIDDLILIPHIALHLIPFAALPLTSPAALTPSPSPIGRGKPEATCLGDRFQLRIVPSARILSYCQDRENGNPTAPFVPGSQFGSVEDATGDRPIATAGFEAIAQRLNIPPTQRLRGKQQATKANYLALAKAPTTQALHSIHHAASNLGNPLDSALQLADGNITLGQLLSPGWRMPHLVDVFLSCCETNLGTPNLTDDLLTLSTGFLCAGARSVVSTLWSVDALATALFCNFYYQFRDQGSDRPTALQQAQHKLRTLTGKELKDQYANSLTQLLIAKGREAAQAGNEPVAQAASRALAQINAYKQQPNTRIFESPYFWAGFVSQGLR